MVLAGDDRRGGDVAIQEADLDRVAGARVNGMLRVGPSGVLRG